MDIPDIRVAVQFAAPDSLSVMTQRIGRAGRDGKLAHAVILVQDAMFELKTPHRTANTEDTERDPESKLTSV